MLFGYQKNGDRRAALDGRCPLFYVIKQWSVAKFMLAFYANFDIMKIRRTKSFETPGFWKEINKKEIFYECNQHWKRQTGVLG